MKYRELFSGLRSSGASKEEVSIAAQLFGFSPGDGLDAEVPPERIEPFARKQPVATSPEDTLRLRSLAPGMPTVAEVQGSRLTPVETVDFSEEEASFATPPSPGGESETARFADTAILGSPLQPRMEEAQRKFEQELDKAPGAAALRRAERSAGEMFDLATRDEEPRALELARDAKPKDEPDFLSRAAGRALTSGEPLTAESITRASISEGVGEPIEMGVEYAADLAGTTAGLAVGAAEPIAGGLMGVAAALGIQEDAYDAAVTRMERTLQETAKFYESKLDETLVQNMRDNASEIQSGMFQLGEVLFSGALTREELEAADAIDRLVAGFNVGREIGAQGMEGAVAAFALLLSQPGTALKADPLGTFLTVAPLFKAIKAGRLKVDMDRIPGPTRDLINRTTSLYDRAVQGAAESKWGADAIARGRELQAKATRALAREGASIESKQQALWESVAREPEFQGAAVKSAGVDLARRISDATKRGEIPIPESTPQGVRVRATEQPDLSAPDILSRPQEGTEGTRSSEIFGADDPQFSAQGVREFEVFRAGIDPRRGDISLKKTTKEDRTALARELRELYVSQGMDKRAAAKKARRVAKRAGSRGVFGYRRIGLDQSREQLFRSLGSDARRIIEEMGGTSLVKGEGRGAGLVDLAGDEFLEAMGEAINTQAANILNSASLRRSLVKAVAERFRRAAGRNLDLSEIEGIDRIVHEAASRMPVERGALGSAKTYDVVFDLPDGTEATLLDIARDLITDDRKFAARVFEETLVATAERMSHKVRQRRRQRGWLDAVGGRDAVKAGSAPSASAEALKIATDWIDDVESGRVPSLPAVLMNRADEVHAAMRELPPEVLNKIPSSLWSRFRKGGDKRAPHGYQVMPEDMLQYVGLVDMPPDVQKVVRAVRIEAPFKSADNMAPIYVPKHVLSALRMMKKTEDWRVADTWLSRFERSLKGNMVARNIGSFMNAAAGNLLFQSVRRGDVAILPKMIQAVSLYRKWKTGKLTDPDDIRMLEDIDRTGALGSTYVQSELNKAYGEGKGGLLSEVLSKHAAGRGLSRAIELQEAGFSWTDSGAKLEDAIHNYRKLSRYMDMLDEGDWLQARVGTHQVKRIYKGSEGRWRDGSPDGRILSDAQVGAIKGRAAVRPGLNAFFDYSDPSRAARILRGGSKAGIFVGTMFNPYWTWQNKAMTIPGVQRGLAGEVMSNGPPVVTNNKRVRMEQAMDQAAIGVRRAALVQGARNMLGDREYHEALREAHQYSDSDHKGTVSTFNRLANPAYVSSKNWSSSAFLEPFDNLLGVIDAIVSAPPSVSAKEIDRVAGKNKHLRDSSNPWAAYDDMTMFFGSLDPNDEYHLNSVFPAIPPTAEGQRREAKMSKTLERAFGAADSTSMREVPPEHRQEVRRIRNIWRGAWSGRKSGIASAAELAGLSGGILERLSNKFLDYAKDEATAGDVWRQAAPLIMGGTAARVSKAAQGIGSPFRWLPPDADYADSFDKIWMAVTGLGKVHLRAAGKPNTDMGERTSVLGMDVRRLKSAMRKSFRDGLGREIIDLNKSIKSKEAALGAEVRNDADYLDEVRQRDNALKHWHRIMGSSAPGEKKPSRGGLINEIAGQWSRYVEEGWKLSPIPFAPGERRQREVRNPDGTTSRVDLMPRHTAFDFPF